MHCTKSTSNGQDLPLSLPLITQFSGVMMSVIMAIYGYVLCQDGTFKCVWLQDFPYMSAVMGLPPQNKLYAIMMTFYAWQKQATVRAYYHTYAQIGVSPILQAAMLVACAVSCVAGPGIGFFDCYYDIDIHQACTNAFVMGEVVYCITAIQIITTSRDKFDQGIVQTRIAQLVYCKYIALALGVAKLYQSYGYDIGVFDVYIEWIAFNSSFLVFILLSTIMPYTLKVQKEE